MSNITKIINHPGGHVEKILIDDNPTPPPASKIIGLDELEALLPDEVLVELEAIKNDPVEVVAKRAAVTRVLNAMARGAKIDAYSDKFNTLMNRLKNNTALTAGQSTAIVDILRE